MEYEIKLLPVEVFTLDLNIIHPISNLPLPLLASSFLFPRAHGVTTYYENLHEVE
jgi:hypothetical protein